MVPLSTETVTVTCSKHRRRCTAGPIVKGAGVRIWHADGCADGAPCDSQAFKVVREQEVSREGAHAELIVLYLNWHRALAVQENDSAATAAARED